MSTFSVFLPPQAETGAKLPVVWYLSGLTCTHANVTDKGEYRAACAELGLIFVAPDTSPRGEGVPDDPDGAAAVGELQMPREVARRRGKVKALVLLVAAGQRAACEVPGEAEDENALLCRDALGPGEIAFDQRS